MSVICEVYQSHELTWRVQGCEPKWNQNDQKTELHSMSLYPDLDYTSAHATSTYVRYTGADKIRDLLLAIHEVICKKVNADSGKKKEEVKEAALPPSSTGQNLPSTQANLSPATLPKYETPATTPAYDATKYVNKEADTEQKALPAPPTEEPVKEEPKQEEEKKEPTGDCCDYYIKITTDKIRLIEQGAGSSNIRFRYLMSENLLKDLGGEKISNADKFKITITPASNSFSKAFTSSFEMNLDEFNSTDPNYPGNLIVAIVPTLELEVVGSESLPSKEGPKSYSEVSAGLLRKRIYAIESDPANKNMTPEQKNELFMKIITRWEEDTRSDVEAKDAIKKKNLQPKDAETNTTTNTANINNKKV